MRNSDICQPMALRRLSAPFDPGMAGQALRRESPPRARPVVLSALNAPDRDLALALMGSDPWSEALATDSPALFFLLLRIARRERLPVAATLQLVRLPRTDILARAGCDASASTERFLRRVAFRDLSIDEENALRALLREPLPAWARHWRHPHLSLLTQVHEVDRPAAATAFDNILRHDPLARARNGEELDVAALIGHWGKAHVRAVLDDIIEICRLIDYTRQQWSSPVGECWREAQQLRLARCRNLDELAGMHQHLVHTQGVHWEQILRQRVPDQPWPGPPLDGSDHIIPVDSLTALCEEGTRMHHCIATYGERILKGEGYVYRVLSPQRATLYIVPDGLGRWHLRELRLSCNRTVSDETTWAVLDWLDAANRATGQS